MCRLNVLWWIPDDGDWEHGWKVYDFPSENAAIAFCRGNLSGIEFADLMPCDAHIVANGKLLCSCCERALGPDDNFDYLLCADCDAAN